jgi:hypothetical protein
MVIVAQNEKTLLTQEVTTLRLHANESKQFIKEQYKN